MKEGRLIGYARVSTTEQSVAMQIEALEKYGVSERFIFSESASGAKKGRPALAKAMRAARDGDTLVVWKLDRIARSLTHLLELVGELEAKGAKFKSLTEGIETQTPAGRLLFHMIGSLAQFERDLIRERTQAGVDAAKARGTPFGRKHKLPASEMPNVWRMIREEGKTQKEVAAHYGIEAHTIARRLKAYEAEPHAKKRASK